MAEERRRVRAPEFPGGMEWLNTERPLRLAELRGKVVILDFWTYCCINCMHVIPDLKRLEAKYPRELVVIGVHSAKFTNERILENIRQAILRYELEHPVVNDSNFLLWREYGVRAWPTLVLIDPRGYLVGTISGEGVFDALDRAIEQFTQEARLQGILDERPIPFRLERERSREAPLSFPGKVLAEESSGQLFIADSNHNRILVCSLEGEVREVVGEGSPGADDGGFEKARFNHPQGMALREDRLYVADTENHLLREVDLKARQVRTLAGTGAQAREFNPEGLGREVALNSPWDLVWANGSLFIAMAGPHQIWKMDLPSGRLSPHAGSGREGLQDGPLRESALAQPSGISTDGKLLYVADSEVSAIRTVDLHPGGSVQTLVGLDLFEFGDLDGEGDGVRLQHPLGVHFHEGRLYVADTYNHKIKVVYPSLRACQSLFGNGRPGHEDGGSPTLYEPGGLTTARGHLYIADTNNHAIRVASLAEGQVLTLPLSGV